MNNKNSNIQEAVFAQIESGQIKMKPKLYFILGVLFFVLAMIAVISVSVYVVSFLFFVLHASGALLLPGFGLTGVMSLLLSLPWVLILLAGALIVLSEVLCKKFAWVYRRPMLHSVLILVVVMSTGGVLLLQSSIHEDAMVQAQHDELPVLGSVYKSYAEKTLANTFVGQVVNVTEDGFEMIWGPEGNVNRVIVTKHTRLQPADVQVAAKDDVVCLGEKDDERGIIEARGVRVLESSNRPYFYMIQQASTK